jgi:hypothetical protein
VRVRLMRRWPQAHNREHVHDPIVPSEATYVSFVLDRMMPRQLGAAGNPNIIISPFKIFMLTPGDTSQISFREMRIAPTRPTPTRAARRHTLFYTSIYARQRASGRSRVVLAHQFWCTWGVFVEKAYRIWCSILRSSHGNLGRCRQMCVWSLLLHGAHVSSLRSISPSPAHQRLPPVTCSHAARPCVAELHRDH